MTGSRQEPRRPLGIRWSDRARDDLASIGVLTIFEGHRRFPTESVPDDDEG